MSGPNPSSSPAQSSLWYRGFHTLGISVALVSLGFVHSFLTARVLGPTGKGSYDLVRATVMLLAMILGLSLQSGIVYVIAKYDVNIKSLFLQLVVILLTQGLATIFIMYGLSLTDYLDVFIAHTDHWMMIVVCLLLIFTQSTNYWRAMLIGFHEIVKANWRTLIGRILQVALLLLSIGIAAILRYESLTTFAILSIVPSSLLSSVLLLHAVRPHFSQTAGINAIGEIVGYSLPCYFGNVVQFLNYRVDVFVVKFFSTTDAVGLYTLAVTLAQMIWLISQATATVLFPQIAAAQQAVHENAARTARAARLILWGSAGAALLMGVCAYPVIPLLYGEAFAGSIAPLIGLLPGITIFGAATVLASYLAGVGKPRLNLYVALMGLFVTITLDLLLIPSLGTVGAAIASTASYSTSAVLTIWLFTRQADVRMRSILIPTTDDIRSIYALARAALRHIHLFKG
jgi:O-antigen/teichoic acid export membrane protein